MAITVRIPTVLRPATANQATLSVTGTTIGEVLGAVIEAYPATKGQLLNEDGGLHRFLNVYVNDDDVRYLGGVDAPVADGDEVTLLPAVAGGATA
jgi:sulfur-carrier protein